MDSMLALIPARGGSKGLPNKNILQCAGRPLIAWTIKAALESGVMSDVVVSTDSVEIAKVAQESEASVPFLRPAHLSTDEAGMLDVLNHAWKNLLDAQGKRYQYIVLLQPTSPMRGSAHIRAAVRYYFSHQKTPHDTLASVYQVNRKYGWMMHVSAEDGYVRFCLNVDSDNPQRQKLGDYYLPNGAIFIASGESLSKGLYGENTLPFIMDEADSLDVDTRDDLNMAEQMLLSRI